MVAEMVILDVEVLCTWAHFGDLRHRQRSTVVLKDFAMDFRRSHHVRDAMTLGFPEQLHQRDDLPQSGGQSDVLSFGGRKCNLRLEFGSPGDGASCIEDDPTAS